MPTWLSWLLGIIVSWAKGVADGVLWQRRLDRMAAKSRRDRFAEIASDNRNVDEALAHLRKLWEDQK